MAKQQTSPPKAAAEPKVAPRAATKAAPAPREQQDGLPPYNVVLLDDNDHTHAYVIEMLRKLFAFSAEKALTLAEEVDQKGRVIVLITHKEKAELKAQQITGYGADPRCATCKGSMSAIIEPAAG